MSNGGSITLRLAVAGAPEVKAALASLGPVGAQAMRQIEQAQRAPSAGMKALNSIAIDAKKGLNGIVEEAGTAGRALEHFGAGGLAVAAGIGAALAVGEKLLEATHAAMEYGEALETAATAAGVSTEKLQQYRYAAEQSGIATQAADEALRKFTQSFGLAKEGSQRQLKFFDLLFTPEDMRKFQTVDEALDATVDKIASLPDAAERAAIAKRLGLEALIPLLQTNRDRISELREEAVKLGVVMDENTVRALAEAEKKFKSASDVINTQFKSAVVGLTPILVGMIEKIAEMVRGLDAFLSRFRGIETRSRESLAAENAQLAAQAPGAGHWEVQARGGGHTSARVWVVNPPAQMIATGGGHGPLRSTDQDRLDTIARNNAQIAKIDAAAAAEAAAAKANLKSTGSDFVPDHKGPDQAKLAEERAKASDALIASASLEILAAKKSELQAQLSATQDVSQRADLELQLVDLQQQEAHIVAERKVKLAQHDLALNKISKEAEHQAELAAGATKDAEDHAAQLKRHEIKRQRDQALQDQANQLAETGLQGQIDALRAQYDITTTMRARHDLALRIFDLEEQLAEQKLQEVIASKTATDAQIAQAKLELENLRASQGDRRTAAERANPSSPWEQWRTDALAATADVNQAFQQISVDGLEQFNQSLFDSEGRLNSLGDIAKSVFSRMLVDLEQYLLKQAEIGLFGGGGGGGGGFLSSLFGGFGSVLGSGGAGGTFDGSGWDFLPFAGGGRVVGPGTGTSDSIFAALSNGEFVVNAKATQRFLPMLTAINENRPMPIPRFAAGGMVGGHPGAGAGFVGGQLNLQLSTAINAPGADAAALMRVNDKIDDHVKQTPILVRDMLIAAGLIGKR